MPQRKSIGELAKKKFTSEDFMNSLASRTPLEEEFDMTTDPVESDNLSDWDEIVDLVNQVRGARSRDTGPDLSQYEGMSTELAPEEPGLARKVLGALTDPLSGGAIGRWARENSGKLAPEFERERFKATGDGGIQDWLAWAEATGKGATRGALEGVADVADQFTSPADLAGLALTGGAFGAASRGWKAANALRQAARATGLPIMARGGQRIYDVGSRLSEGGEFDMSEAGELAAAGLEIGGGGLQTYFPASSLPKGPKPKAAPGTKPKIKATAPLQEMPAAEIEMRPDSPDLAGETGIQRDFGRGRANRQEIRPILDYSERGIAETYRGAEPPRGLPPEQAVAEINAKIDPSFADAEPTTVAPIEAAVEATDPNAIVKPGDIKLPDINDQLFPELAGRTPKRNINLGVQEAAAPKGATAVDPNARIDELAGKSFLTAAEEAELNGLIDSLTPTDSPGIMERVGNFMADEKGEIDFSKLFQGEEDMGYSVRTNDPDTIDIGDVAGDIDLNQAAIDAGADLAKPVTARPRVEYAFDWPGFHEDGSPERMFHILDGPEAGSTLSETSLRSRGIETPQQSAIQRFVADEAGEIRFSGGKGKKEPKAPKNVPKAADVWANLPDRVKQVFEENGIGVADIEGMTLKDVNDTYDSVVSQMAGLEQPAADVPLVKEMAPGQMPRDVVDVSKIKLPEGPKLVGKTGERKGSFASPEDARIAQLEKELIQDIANERAAAIEAGERELSPEALADVKARFAQENQVQPAELPADFMPPAEPENLAVRYGREESEKPLLRMKNLQEYLKKLARDEKGEIDFSALMGGGEIQPGTSEFGPDLMLNQQDVMGGQAPEFTPRMPAPDAPQAPGMMDMIRNFMQDESGELNLGDPPNIPYGRSVPPTKGGKPTSGPNIRLLEKDQLDPNVPIRERNIPKEPEPSNFREAWNLGQSMMSIDLPYLTSAAFRQASPLAWTENWFKSWTKAAEAFGSKEAADALEAEIRNSKYFKKRYKPVMDSEGQIKAYKELPSIAEEAGVRMSDLKHLTQREETLRGTWAEKIPVYGDYVKKSNRAYTAFLNSLRKAKFEEMMDARQWSGKANDQIVAKQIAEFVNDATGRSSLKARTPFGEVSAEKNADNLAMALWSPRLLASRLKFLNPLTYTRADPMVRQEYLNGLFRTMGTWTAFAGLAKMMGAQVSLDPTNADFGKVRIGNTRIDPGAGFQQLLVFGSRMGTGKFTSSNTGETSTMGEGFKPRTRKSTAEEFLASKLHPSAKLAYDLLSASQSSPVHLTDRAVQMALPMMAQDLLEVMKADPELAGLIGPLSSVGFGTSNYGRGDEFGAPVFTDTIEDFMDLPRRSISGTVGGKTPKRY